MSQKKLQSKRSSFLSLLLSLSLILSSLLSPLTSSAAYSQSSAQTYLQSHATDLWAVLGLASLGAQNVSLDFLKNISSAKATDYEAPILALTAFGKDPKTFSSSDYVAKLESFHTAGQIGDASLLNDDFFGVLALVSAGVPTTDSAITDSKNFILANQNSDGGWSWGVGSASDSDDTAAAITALIAAGISPSDSHITKGFAYIKTAQNSDGGFTSDPKSPYGTASDASSTAWVMWAITAAGQQVSSWSNSGHLPADYLSSTQTGTGFFAYQSGSPEDSFSPATTGYAVIALAGKSIPLSAPAAPSFPFRIEGSSNTVCTGTAAGPTPLDIIKNAAGICGYTYNIQSTSLGLYLNQINNDTATGATGWLYLVNNIPGSSGASTYMLKSGDQVLWYFGQEGWAPTQLNLVQPSVGSGQNAQATVKAYSGGSFIPLSDAAVNFGASSANSDGSGNAALAAPDGFYKIFATKTGYIRSNQVLLQVGSPSSSNIALTVTVPQGGQVAGTSTGQSNISFTVNPSSLDFGNLKPGQSTTKNFTINNTGSVNITAQAQVNGSDVFKNGLSLNNIFWQSFQGSIIAGQNLPVSAKLTVPPSFSGSGQQSGQIVIWASSN